SSITAAPKYLSASWRPSTATSKLFFEGVAATRISPTCCSKRSAWRPPRPNSSFFRKQPKMRVSTDSCAEPDFPNKTVPLSDYFDVTNSQAMWLELCNLVLRIEADLAIAQSFKGLEPAEDPGLDE